MTKKLTPKQENVLNRLKDNVECIFMSGCYGYWFMVDNHEKVTTQIISLKEKGFIKINVTGINDRSIVIITEDANCVLPVGGQDE